MKESNTRKRLELIMDETGMKQVDILKRVEPFSKKYGVKLSKSDLSLYLKEKATPNQDKLAILAMGLNVNEAWLMGYDVPRERVKDTTNERYLEFYATDDSMAPLLNINDIAYVNEQSTYNDNDTILFEYNDLLQIRKVNIKDGYIELRAMNPYFPLIVIKDSELSKIRVIGKVIKAENQSAFK